MQKKYELICMDLDGTLLDEKKLVSVRAKKNLTRAAEMGIHIALLSGRMPHAIEIVEEQIGLSCIKGSAAGTYVVLDGRCLCDRTMSTEDMLFMYEAFARKYAIPLWVYKGTKWYVTSVDWYVERESGLIGLEPTIIDIYALKEEWDRQGTGPNKILFGASAEMVQEIKAELEKTEMDSLDFARSDTLYLEVFPKGVNKGSAITAICEALQIDPGKTIAFGDQELDIPMFEHAAFGVAMANSPEHVKKFADTVTLSNEEDGVAIALEQYVLN